MATISRGDVVGRVFGVTCVTPLELIAREIFEHTVQDQKFGYEELIVFNCI